MANFIDARDRVVDKLRQELVGPKPAGKSLNTAAAVRFDNWDEATGPWRDAQSGEEILTEAGPTTRYGVGVLFAVDSRQAGGPDTSASNDSDPASQGPDYAPGTAMPDAEFDILSGSLRESLCADSEHSDDDDFDLDAANAYKPSALGVTCRVRMPAGSRITLTATFGRYRELPVRIGTSTQTWFRRTPVALKAAFSADRLTQFSSRKTVTEDPHARLRTGDEDLNIVVEAYSRPTGDKFERLVTFYVANRTGGRKDIASLFQAQFKVHADDGATIMPYHSTTAELSDDTELASIALLYRDNQTFAVGHGCAADWKMTNGRVASIEAAVLPEFETPSITPVIKTPDGNELRVDMRILADLNQTAEANRQIQQLLDSYSSWIDERQTDISSLPEQLRTTAQQHLDECRVALGRMRYGWDLARSDPTVRTAFALANRAMLTQQARSSAGLRRASLDSEGGLVFDGLQPTSEPGPKRGFWRPFQIAFILAVLESVTNGDSKHRETVELIFFPTGGGKTEAYLGVAAFGLFLRRLRTPRDGGTDVLMRYTLRLLTTQQFLRASALICAMEEIRERRDDLGEIEFSIGIWVGGDSTPNKRSHAQTAFKNLSKGGDNPFLLLRCPWCNAEFGAIPAKQRRSKGAEYAIAGYFIDPRKKVVRFRCSDYRCRFSRRCLPVYVVDEDLYDIRPSLVIGTVDKFALLAWRPEARKLFGLNLDGSRAFSPPGLVIQDELHLISGPLGSMAGLYEGVIEELCTDYLSDAVKPKIIASTATIRRYREQVRCLYGRETTQLFPPHGLNADDSFFATWARDSAGILQRGRRYIGVHAPGLGSMQTTQVRTSAALLQAPMELLPDERDPWWTCLTFFNSLRELGNTLTLLQADIPTYLGGLNKRDGLDKDRQRWPKHTPELTSRLKDHEVPQAIAALEIGVGEKGCIDVCLASSIIEVGIDIDRLSLMTVVGQPKTTAQYIQVTGRVGRRWDERPGLVVTLYGAAKPRDRSHFERFRSYHERLYAQVEPTSVTPFALPVLERAAHAALVAYVRQLGPSTAMPPAVPQKLIDDAAELLRRRAHAIGASSADLERVLAKRLREWQTWERTSWDAHPEFGDVHNGLMRYPGTTVPAETRRVSWETPSSMRNVDASCRIQVTTIYAAEAGELPEKD
ncbi:helicase-related protein [Nocardia sp. NPDC050412]|uniref:helicase-related protein n=1 Tax=Nocardia sp. NPDC050412 TaxID=3364320 RepID=UPI0037924A02